MSMEHELLYDNAISAITKLFMSSDLTKDEISTQLDELRIEIQVMIDSLSRL